MLCSECEARRRHAKGRIISPTKSLMTYLEQFEAELKAKLAEGLHMDVLVRWISEKILESYRNGITAGKKGESVIRNGKSRRR
jgi:hypothetical protein